MAISAEIAPHSAALPAALPVPSVTAIVPARNEEAVIAECVSSLGSQLQLTEVLVVDDQSTDATASIVQSLSGQFPKVRLLESGALPEGWVGKNRALWLGVQQARTEWLLFTDADSQHQPDSVAQALKLAQEKNAALVSFSPEQVTRAWYEKALIPFIYLRLAKHFSFDSVNDPKSSAAAANGQFLMIRRDVYDSVGGHSAVAGEILEDVALAMRVKSAGHRLFFGSGKGIVRVRMYRSFQEMWLGWRKNLYRLMGGTAWRVFRETEAALPWIPLLLIALGLKYPLLLFAGVLLFIARQTAYGLDLSRNQYPFSFIFYYVPAFTLYISVLWASYRGHVSGRILWKGREYSVGAPESVK